MRIETLAVHAGHAVDPATGAVAGGLKAADQHYKWLSEKFGYSIPTPEVLINQIGYQ